ncbi:hypothetical protein [Providencia burhodogranariea]|uniref:Type III secretion protein n=1 Tax=Providencia burhodogranariea DSM 19968 TaxID=1141662 RepID=K8WVD3_9GAMM|nr:hypothetical protein [Providencia burhodogranariea]EKT64629.1 hypothetical protein OOA_02492 [Providencia burhodogranariea DSM 19968]
MSNSVKAEPPVEPPAANDRLTTNDVGSAFEGFISKADESINKFLAEKTDEETGALNLSSADSLQLQRLMADQSIAAQTGTSTLKAVKDNITAAARNI